MGLFSNKYEDTLNNLLDNIYMNMSNNYKDAAQEDLISYERKLNEIIELGKLNKRAINRYNNELKELKDRLKGYTHKDQKPNW